MTSTPGVTLGADGWLYLASDAAVSSFRATRPFTPGQLEGYRQTIEAQARLVGLRGIPYVLVIPPNKDTIYPEFVPPAYNKVNRQVAPRSARRSHEIAYRAYQSSTSGMTCGRPSSLSEFLT